MYKLIPSQYFGTPSTCVKRLEDSVFIPFDEDNFDYQEYLKWVAEGNEPLPADAPTEE